MGFKVLSRDCSLLVEQQEKPEPLIYENLFPCSPPRNNREISFYIPSECDIFNKCKHVIFYLIMIIGWNFL